VVQGGVLPAHSQSHPLHHGWVHRVPTAPDRLGPHSTGKACLYIKDLDEVDPEILNEIIARSVAAVEEREGL